MKELHEYISLCLDSLKEPLFLLDRDFQCVFANNAFLDLIAKSPDQFVAFPAGTFWPSVDDEAASDVEVATELLNARGEKLWVKLIPSLAQDGYRCFRIVGVSSGRDPLSGFHSQRLETLGMLAGGVAHDFNNALAGILGHITYLKTVLPPAGSHIESLNSIEAGAKKASQLTQQILNFSRLDTTKKPVPVNLGALIIETCVFLERAVAPEYKIEHQIPEDTIYCLGVEGKLAQVIINLVMNGRDASPPDSTVHVYLERISDLDYVRQVFDGKDLSSKQYACVKVVDQGSGMPEEVLRRAFDPYFSTKGNRGTGLGLSMVHAIVRLFGGAIDVQSELGNGTAISVLFPVVNVRIDAAQEGEAAQPSQALSHGVETIMVVDDEYPVRNVLSVSLEHLGYKVQVAASGHEALEIYRTAEEPIDLVLLDMLMPAMSGQDVFYQLKELNPDVKVVIISGFTSEQSVQDILRDGGMAFLQKPFTIEELSEVVRECLDRSPEE